MFSYNQPSKNLLVVADQNEEISGDNWEEEEEFDEGDAVFSSDEYEDVADKDEDAEQKEKGGDNMDSQEDTKPQQPEGKGRIKRQCPVPYCKKKVVHIPRHLVNVHGWSYSRSRAAVTHEMKQGKSTRRIMYDFQKHVLRITCFGFGLVSNDFQLAQIPFLQMVNDACDHPLFRANVNAHHIRLLCSSSCTRVLSPFFTACRRSFRSRCLR